MKLFVAILALRSIVPTNTTDLCQGNITCGNGEPHFMCVHQPPRCHPFTLLHLGSDQIHSFLFGHNGIRNRVARQYQIANMNIVHWSVSLELMAERFLGKCRMERDACQDVRVSYKLIKIISFTKVWQSWKNFYKRRPSDTVGNYSQLIYPSVQFIGCNGGHFPTGHYVFVCYYWPRSSKNYEDGFLFGKPCSQCDRKVPACSRVFTELCGIDIEVSKAMKLLKKDTKKLLSSLVLLFLLNSYF
ncbi:cysteine-rich venom protein pseudecin-like isoform X2 [Anastrepha obliqua]|uniref:cysteine-rich venom protein pseudecin-like isoform X2 n=1 Tax=Anastrepha obliqua TaxID=95512 RepID=UPI002408F923|nr:cysteine-rich venom protein pseudecin-like isoform X2 [Anastrepha obliqua]